jgi:hypothetical protein
VIDFLANAGDAFAFAGGVDPFVVALAGASLSDAYRHSLSDLIHVAQRGFCSSHLIRRDRQVRLKSQSAMSKQDGTSLSAEDLCMVSQETRSLKREICYGPASVGPGFTHQPVVVLNPLALEGRGFRGLGAPDEVTGISDKVAHAGVTSLRGRTLASG